MTAFSPSQTSDYGFCPRYWQLRRAYRTRLIGYPELCGILGTAFSAAMEIRNKGRMAGVTPSQVEIMQQVAPVLGELLEKAHEGGRKLTNDTRTKLMAERLPVLLSRAVGLIMSNDPLKDYKILKAEPVQSEGGNSRPDVVAAQIANGTLLHQPSVIDYKLKVDCQEQWIPSTLDQYERSWQLYHYCFFEHLYRYQIVLVVLGPKPMIRTRTYEVDASYMQVFMEDSRGLWTQIEQTNEWLSKNPDGWVTGSPIHENKYGECDFARACLVHGLDRQLIEVDYIRRNDGIPRIDERPEQPDSQNAQASVERASEQP